MGLLQQLIELGDVADKALALTVKPDPASKMAAFLSLVELVSASDNLVANRRIMRAYGLALPDDQRQEYASAIKRVGIKLSAINPLQALTLREAADDIMGY